MRHRGRCHNWDRPKVRYSEKRAKAKARGMNRKYKEKFSAFSCPHCGEWHVGRDSESDA